VSYPSVKLSIQACIHNPLAPPEFLSNHRGGTPLSSCTGYLNKKGVLKNQLAIERGGSWALVFSIVDSSHLLIADCPDWLLKHVIDFRTNTLTTLELANVSNASGKVNLNLTPPGMVMEYTIVDLTSDLYRVEIL
jgi:hypothetical protein